MIIVKGDIKMSNKPVNQDSNDELKSIPINPDSVLASINFNIKMAMLYLDKNYPKKSIMEYLNHAIIELSLLYHPEDK